MQQPKVCMRYLRWRGPEVMISKDGRIDFV
jgi:hypothetical protein